MKWNADAFYWSFPILRYCSMLIWYLTFIRSDTNTIKTGSQDHIDRVHAASSGNLFLIIELMLSKSGGLTYDVFFYWPSNTWLSYSHTCYSKVMRKVTVAIVRWVTEGLPSCPGSRLWVPWLGLVGESIVLICMRFLTCRHLGRVAGVQGVHEKEGREVRMTED